MNISLIQTVWTVIAFVIFVGIVIWAWSGRRKEDFDKAALDDDKPIDSNDLH
jgi:cytochrome c oxidase cbb3-type subunit 4